MNGPPTRGVRISAALTELRARLAVGAPAGPTTGLPPVVQRHLRLAGAVGGPLLDALDAAVAVLTEQERLRRALRVATAQAQAVAVGLVLMPLVAVPGLSALLGGEVAGFYRTPAGHAVAVLGGLLVLAGAVSSRWLIRRVTRSDPGPTADEVADLVATAAGAGLAPGAALRAVADVVPDLAPRLARVALAVERGADATDPDLSRIAAVCRTAAVWGAPVVPALRQLAAELRAERATGRLAAASRLPALLTLPTALFLLPATVLLVAAPLVAAGLDAVGPL